MASRKHDHRQCVSKALADAESVCNKQNARLTPIRKRVLELVWDSHEPIGAYDILARLSREREKATPPTVYRALEFLMDVGLVHRIDSLNSFLGCRSPTRQHVAQFLVCRSCHHVDEIDSVAVQRALMAESRKSGFTLEPSTFEVKGLCGDCASQSSSSR
jgi:Fur family zinc uptake transcriptional regulator